MSLYGDAVAAIRSLVLIEERLQAQGRKVDQLSRDMVELRDRVIRLEAIVEIALHTRGTARRVTKAPPDDSG
jgi:hypothetical protein